MSDVSKYESAGVEHAALNKHPQQQKERRVAPGLNEAGSNDADRATTEVPYSKPKYEPTATDRAARLSANGVARSGHKRRFDRPVSKVQSSEPKHEPKYSLKERTQQQEEQPVAPPFNKAGPGDAGRATAEVSNSELKLEPTVACAAPTEVPKHERTDAERATLNKQAQREKEQPSAPRFKMGADYRGFWIVQDHPDSVAARSLTKEALATANDALYDGLLNRLIGLINFDDSYDREDDLNFLLSIIIDGKPKDGTHSLLLSHMALTTNALMQEYQNLSRIQRRIAAMDRDLYEISPFLIEKTTALIKSLSAQEERSINVINQLARTFCKQLDASEHYRRSGEPSTTVHVAPGGQAIVGNVTHANPQTAPNNPTATLRALTDQQHTAMPIIGEPDRVPVPVRRRKNQ